MPDENPTARGRWLDAAGKVLPEPTRIRWLNTHVVGPFDNTGHQGLFAELPPEHDGSLDSVYAGKHGEIQWIPAPDLDLSQPADLSNCIPSEGWSAVFLHSEVEADVAQIARLSIGSYAIPVLWFNGLPVLAPKIPYPSSPENNEVLVALRPGTNCLLIELLFMNDQWGLDFRGDLLGPVEEVVSAFRQIAEDSDDGTTRFVARFALVEAFAAQNKANKCHQALNELRNDPLASKWDLHWAERVAAQHAATGTFLPLRDAQVEYAPVPNPHPISTFWPQSAAPAEELLVTDVSNATPQEEFAVSVLQGLINRSQPRLYLLHTRYARQDRLWLDELHGEGMKSREVSSEEVWQIFRSEIRGAVLYDGSIMDEIGAFHSDQLNVTNLIMMIGATENAVPVTPEMNESLDLPVVFDARGTWNSQFEMMRWAYSNVFPRMDQRILATNYPGIFLLTDYLVQFKIFTFWFPEHRTLPESNLLDGILASTPPNTPIIGWWFDWMPNARSDNQRHADAVMELPGLLRGSYFGKVLTPSHEATNLSVHSGMPVKDIRHKKPDTPEFDPSKVYYCHIISDGDNLGEALIMRTRDLQWDRPERGSFPVGWSFAPAAARMAPPVLNYYLRTASPNDLLVGGLGVGYTHPTIYLMAYPEQRDALYETYARMTDEALSWIDTSCLWLIDGGEDDEDRFAGKSSGQLEGIFTGYGGGPEEAAARRAPNDVIAFRSATRNTEYAEKDNLIQDMVDEIRQGAGSTRPAFVEAWVLNWDWEMSMLKEVQDRLGSEFVCVRPDVLVELRRQRGV